MPRGTIVRIGHLTVRRRILGAFLVVLVLLASLAAVMWHGANTVIEVAGEVRAGSAATDLATDIALAVADAVRHLGPGGGQAGPAGQSGPTGCFA